MRENKLKKMISDATPEENSIKGATKFFNEMQKDFNELKNLINTLNSASKSDDIKSMYKNASKASSISKKISKNASHIYSWLKDLK